MNDITNLLKEATKDLLSEESLKAIAEAVEKKAEEKVQLAVEAALVKQDEEYASKLEKVLETASKKNPAIVSHVNPYLDMPVHYVKSQKDY